MRTIIHERVEQARAGENPKVVCKAPSGWIVMGDSQFLRGYCLILPDPVVPNLNAMSLETRVEFLRDMSLLGDAIIEITGAVRCNYEILGNVDPALHAHVFPRFNDEPEELRTRPVWFYDWKAAPQFDRERDFALMKQIAANLLPRFERL
jgi:diadenosine tetraphosphate (Ap4A) HIT family hydrolase